MQTFSQVMLMRLYLLGNLPFFKIHVNHLMAWDNSPCANAPSKCMLWVRGLVPFWVFRHSLSAHSFCPFLISVRSFLYLSYTLIQLFYTKALSDQASSLAPDLILPLWKPRILASFMAQQQPFRMKQLGKTGYDVQLWICLVVKVKTTAVKNNII